MATSVAAPLPHRAVQGAQWKVFGLLVGAALLSTVLLLPYLLVLQGEVLRAAPVPLPVLLIATVVQSTVLAAAATALGLWLGPKVGLGAPALRAWLAGEEGAAAALRAGIVSALVSGMAVGLLIGLLDVAVFMPRFADALPAIATPTPWQGLLASFYGAIVEEELLRLGLMTALVWLATRLTRAARPSPAILWLGIAGAALLFGVGHLPAAATLLPLTPLWVGRILLLNGLGGLLFGWLYWRKGLFAAMVGHFGADIVLHVLLPLVLRP